MSHPIVELQTKLIAAWRADASLVSALSGGDVFDAPPKGSTPPYIAIVRHDILSRDADIASGNDHRLLVHCWVLEASRKAVLGLVEPVIDVALTADLSGTALTVTHRQHTRTDTSIDPKTGWARAVIALRFLSEPTS